MPITRRLLGERQCPTGRHGRLLRRQWWRRTRQWWLRTRQRRLRTRQRWLRTRQRRLRTRQRRLRQCRRHRKWWRGQFGRLWQRWRHRSRDRLPGDDAPPRPVGSVGQGALGRRRADSHRRSPHRGDRVPGGAGERARQAGGHLRHSGLAPQERGPNERHVHGHRGQRVARSQAHRRQPLPRSPHRCGSRALPRDHLHARNVLVPDRIGHGDDPLGEPRVRDHRGGLPRIDVGRSALRLGLRLYGKRCRGLPSRVPPGISRSWEITWT
jgi:hypothetical protein